MDFKKFSQIAREHGLRAEFVSKKKWCIHGAFTAEFDPEHQRVCASGMSRPFVGDVYDAIRIAKGIRSSFADSRESRKSLPDIKQQMWEKSPNCHYCGTSLSVEQATIDHVIPVSKGGRNSPANLVVACLSCNHWKANDIVVEVSEVSE